jgi:cell filamentation protein
VTIDGLPGRMHSKRGIDRLPEPLRRCVDQTIAAEALEGWHPTADHVDALVALVDDDVTFGDYLAQYRTRYPPEPTRQTTRRMFHRRRTYLIPGTTLLRNNFGADSHGMLADLEFVSTAGRIAGWHRRLADGDVGADDLNFRAIHQELFSDVYPWAGNYRVTELRRARTCSRGSRRCTG